jgi:hypothetical protein
MKDASKRLLTLYRPTITAEEAINFCLDRLFEDKEKKVGYEVVKGLTFEELIGALLLAKDAQEIEGYIRVLE